MGPPRILEIICIFKNESFPSFPMAENKNKNAGIGIALGACFGVVFGAAYGIISGNISKSYLLINDGVNTIIKQGYFNSYEN